jgi:hypothetical protein
MEPIRVFRAARWGLSLLGLGLLCYGYGVGEPVYFKLYALALVLVSVMYGMGDVSYLTGRKSCAGWTFGQNYVFRLNLLNCTEFACVIVGWVMIYSADLYELAVVAMLMHFSAFCYANIFMNAWCFYKSFTDDRAIIPAEPLGNPPRFDKSPEPGGDQDDTLSYSAAALDALMGECEDVLKKERPFRVSCWQVVLGDIGFVVPCFTLFRTKVFTDAAVTFLIVMMALMIFHGLYSFLTCYIICLWEVVRKNIELHLRWGRPDTLPSGAVLAKDMLAFSAFMMTAVIGAQLAFLYYMEF